MTTSNNGPWPIDVEKLRRQALQLEKIARRYASSDEVAGELYDALEDIIDRAKSGQITSTGETVPCGHSFLEGDFRKFPDLEAAYARFALNLEFGESEQYRKFVKRSEQLAREVREELREEKPSKD